MDTEPKTSSPRPLCADIAEDGLRCGTDWPHCASSIDCATRGCFWRRWHGPIPAHQMRAKVPPRFRDLLVSVDGGTTAQDD